MINVFEVLDWLNEFDVTHLSPALRTLVSMSRDVSQSNRQIQAMIRNLLALAQVSSDPLEVAEITLHCAALCYWRGAYPRSIRLARTASQSYPTDPHREAVARWILGMGLWRVARNDQAYITWDNARQFFKASRNAYRNLHRVRDWYDERLWEMEIDLAFKPEEILHWLNQFEPSQITSPTRQLVNTIQLRIRQRAYPTAYAMMEDLQQVNRWSQQLYERPEVYFECAFFSYQMGNLSDAIQLLRQAVVDFHMGIGTNHNHVVARCMLGAIEWMDPSTFNNAHADWKRCIDQFEELRIRADRDNLQNRKKWYADHRTILQRALIEQLTNVRTPRGNDGATGSSTPGPQPIPTGGTEGPAAPSSGGATVSTAQESQPTATAVSEENSNQPDRYGELLPMVGGDEQIAERLIEFERRTVPNAERKELIERALERLLRDRQ